MEQQSRVYFTKNFEFAAPSKVRFGLGCLEQLVPYLETVGSKRVMIVCGTKFKETRHFSRISHLLGSLLVATYDSVIPHPTLDSCETAGELARNANVDTILSVGGGSSIDTGKAVTLLREHSTKLRDYLVSYDPMKGISVKEFSGTPYRHLAIPTTFSSAEANGSAAVVEPDSRRKLILWSDASLPSAIFLDPNLVSTLPKEMRAASGMNTLAHGIETMYSLGLQPFSEVLAIGSLELIKNNLPKCVHNEGDLEAVGMMQIASVMAGFAYANAVVSLHHAICHVLGATFDIHHGIANSIMIPYVMRDMINYVPTQIARVGYKLGLVPSNTDHIEAARKTVDWVEQFRLTVGAPQRLRDVGVPRDKLPFVAEETMNDWVAFQGLRKIEGPKEIESILESAW